MQMGATSSSHCLNIAWAQTVEPGASTRQLARVKLVKSVPRGFAEMATRPVVMGEPTPDWTRLPQLNANKVCTRRGRREVRDPAPTILILSRVVLAGEFRSGVRHGRVVRNLQQPAKFRPASVRSECIRY